MIQIINARQSAFTGRTAVITALQILTDCLVGYHDLGSRIEDVVLFEDVVSQVENELTGHFGQSLQKLIWRSRCSHVRQAQ